MTAALRVAIVATPRSGNTWLMHLLAKAYGVPALPVPDPRQVDWGSLPPGCVLQIHWHPTPQFRATLSGWGFHTVVIARHPLDVLISILHFCQHDPTGHWLSGEGGTERPIDGATPCSTAFLDYARGPRAAALLAVTPEWWGLPQATRLTYEALVERPEQELKKLFRCLGGRPVLKARQAVAEATIPKLRQQTGNAHHFWQGRPGLWRSLLPQPQAFRIVPAAWAYFRDLGYSHEADLFLTRRQADLNWVRLNWADQFAETQAA